MVGFSRKMRGSGPQATRELHFRCPLGCRRKSVMQKPSDSCSARGRLPLATEMTVSLPPPLLSCLWPSCCWWGAGGGGEKQETAAPWGLREAWRRGTGCEAVPEGSADSDTGRADWAGQSPFLGTPTAGKII